jgi:type I site-specific restriction endonuclease
MTSLAQNREQHMQRFHDQLMAWQEDINRLRAKTFTANSYIQGEMNKLVTQMDKRIEQLTQRLIQVAEKGDRRVYAAMENMESTWGSLRGSISDMMEKMREKRGEAGDRLEDAVDSGRDMLERGRNAVERGADQVQDTVKRGARQARQALDTDQQGQQGQSSQTTVTAQAGRRPAGGTDTDIGTEGGTQGRTQGIGASVTVSRTRGQH